MRVRDLMTPASDVITIEPTATVADAARLLMRHGIGALPVVVGPDRSVLGIIAERDIVKAVDDAGPRAIDRPAVRVMRRPAPTCDPDDTIRGVMVRVTSERLRHMVVAVDGQLAGMVSVGDLLKHRLDDLEMEASVLRDVVAAQRARA